MTLWNSSGNFTGQAGLGAEGKRDPVSVLEAEGGGEHGRRGWSSSRQNLAVKNSGVDLVFGRINLDQK